LYYEYKFEELWNIKYRGHHERKFLSVKNLWEEYLLKEKYKLDAIVESFSKSKKLNQDDLNVILISKELQKRIRNLMFKGDDIKSVLEF
jgi:hypothetical protein